MIPALPPLRLVLLTIALIAVGAVGGYVASRIGLPLPWMIGSLIATALVVLAWSPAPLQEYRFPNGLRSLFVALIGVMIGTQVTPELLGKAASLPVTMIGLALFVAVCHLGNYALFRRVGGYDRATAFYSGTPGGLMESIMMGEGAGADTRILTAQQFLRIIFVISLLPLGLSLWVGAPVGSASGLSVGGPDPAPVPPESLALIAAAAVLGLMLGRVVHLPASQLVGPLILSALATVTGLLDLHLPFWLIATAQLVIGTTLGLRFQGTNLALLRRCAWLSALSVCFMLLTGAAFALVLQALTGIAFLHLLISFAPGGVAEMSIVALSLAANPALVSLHHIARILMTVIELPLMARVMGFPTNAEA